MNDARARVTLFMCGDVMTGRGIDQVFARHVAPHLFEPHVRDARQYVELAEAAHGRIPAPVEHAYVWGDALAELERVNPDVRFANLETAVTTSEDAWPGKAIHYRMHPENVGCLVAAGLHACGLANNHALDWGRAGLAQTFETLHRAGIGTAGAGGDLDEARAPVELEAGSGRVLVFACGSETSGIPPGWAAAADRSGVDLLPDLSLRTADVLSERIRATRRAGDVVVLSIHWGSNWGYSIPSAQREFAHRLIDEGAADFIHGHSSHHLRGIEVYRGRAILYGCGDFLTDYEGISGYEEFRGDLALMYFAVLEAGSGQLVRIDMTPLRHRRFRLERAPAVDARWLETVLDRESRPLGAAVRLLDDGRLLLEPAARAAGG